MAEGFISVRARITVAGRQRDDLGEAVDALTVSRPLHGMAHAELRVVAWGAEGDAQGPAYLFMDIALGDEVQIAFGENPEVEVFKGDITAIEERYGEGAPHLVFLLQDRLHRLARHRQSRSYDQQSPDDLVNAVASAASLQGDANVSSAQGTWHQYNESDLAFLFRVLYPFGIALRQAGSKLRARPEDPDPEPVPLDLTDNALKVRLIADLNHQPRATTVHGFDAAADQDVNGSASRTTEQGRGTTAAAELGRVGWSSDELVPQPAAADQAMAATYAQGHFDRQARAFVTGDIQCVGDPRLAGGREIELRGTSRRLAGRYRVVQCVHSFDSTNGYRTQLRVSRAAWER
jgi:phage protein D